MTDTTSTTVIRNDDESRYEIHVGDVVAGWTEFRVNGDKLVFPHTLVDPAFSGRGLASMLVGQAMADVAARGETVVPLCPFVVKYLDTHDVPGLMIERRNADL